MPPRFADRRSVPLNHFDLPEEIDCRSNMRKNLEIGIDLFIFMVVLGALIAASVGGTDETAASSNNDNLQWLNGTDVNITEGDGKNVTTQLPQPTLSPTLSSLYEEPLADYCLQLTQQNAQQAQDSPSWWISNRNNALQRSMELVLDVQLVNPTTSANNNSTAMEDNNTLLIVVDQITLAMNQYMVPHLIGCHEHSEQQDRSAYAISNASIVHGHSGPNNDTPIMEEPQDIHRVILTLHCLLKGYEDNEWILQKVNDILQEQELVSQLNLTQELLSLDVVHVLPTRAASLKSILGRDLQDLTSERKFMLHPQAFYWLAELDTWKVGAETYEDSSWMSRYVLAVIFYENVFVGDVVNQTDNGGSRFATWLSSENICQWSGLDCNAQGILTRIYLDYDELTGHLPSEIGLLTHLTYLNLFENALTGPIPTEIGRLTSLKSIFLAGNMLTGEIPSHLCELSHLTRLSMPSNNLSGSIPSEIGKLTGLEAVFLSDNRLSGSLPSEIGMLTLMTRLRISSNGLTGTIPVEMRLLTALRRLFMDENDFSGPLPLGIGALAALDKLSFARNSLTGTLPPSIAGLTDLTELYLQGNEFTGAVPTELGRLSNLWENGCQISEGNSFNDTSSLPSVCT